MSVDVKSGGSVPATPAKPKRLAALDQFRGYTMAGMFLVNFIGEFAAVHPLFGHHNTYCSYADTIMPGFFFAVGFSFRISFLRRVKEAGYGGAVRHALWRNVKLFFIGLLAYNIPGLPDLWKEIQAGNAGPALVQVLTVDTFEALVHIACASVWILPVIGLGARARWGYLAFSCLLHIVNLKLFYYGYGHNHVIDGGPLGFIGWSVPTLLGTLVCDAVKEDPSPKGQWRRMWGWAAGFMVSGYALACLNLWGAPAEGQGLLGRVLVEPPFVPPTRPVDMWTMDQQVASPSYMLFGGGFSLLVYLVFVVACDGYGRSVAVFRTLGLNPLFGYLYHSVVGGIVASRIVNGAPLWQVMSGFAVYFAIVWATLRLLEWRGWVWKL